MSSRLKILIPVLSVLVIIVVAPFLTTRRGGNETERISRAIAKQKNKTDNLRNAMRYLKQMTPMNRRQTEGEIRVALNTWLSKLPKEPQGFKPSALVQSIPQEMLVQVGCETPLQFQFSIPDVDYLFQRRLMNSLAKWVVELPLRDVVMQPILEKARADYSAEDAYKLEEAYKLFDWVVRNVDMDPEAASVEERSPVPMPPMQQGGMGYAYLPWEALLFSRGDFVERGRVFMALAQQRGIECVWIEVEGSLWAIGVVIGDELLVFDPKLGMPILEPDKEEFASLAEVRKNERVLRRLDVPGRFDYSYNPGDIKQVRFLVDLEPAALSVRMKLLEEKLLGEERMTIFHDVDALQEKLEKIDPGAEVEMAQFPVMAQIFAIMVRQQLELTSDFKMNYIQKHGMWLMDTPASQGRIKHLFGEHESKDEVRGALALYMRCREDDISLDQMLYDPEIQRRLGVVRKPGQTEDQFKQELNVASYILRKAKVDASFLLGSMHYDRGNYDSAVSWMKGRVLESDNPLAASWNAAAHYTLGRAYAELGQLTQAGDNFSFECPQEPGNRLRLRYLRRRLE